MNTIITNNLTIDEALNRSEKGDAELFEQITNGQIKFDNSEKAFYIKRNSYYELDRKNEIFNMFEAVVREYLEAAANYISINKSLSESMAKRAQQLLSIKRVKNVLEFFARLPSVSLSGDEWDIDPMTLPVVNGLIDLTTGNTRDIKPNELIRVYSPTEWKGLNYPAPLWEKALNDIFDNDKELISYVQRNFGYCITGITKEQKTNFMVGEGSNGKNLVIDTIMNVLGNDFSYTTQTDSLMETDRYGGGNEAKPFIAMLRDKRLVIANESKENQKLNISQMKQLTGDERITARKLRQEPVTFKLTHKIILVTNHLPKIQDGGDYAIWRRIVCVPFGTTFKENPTQPNEKPIDTELSEKLKAEYPGILAWLVRGCLEWQKQGLNPPAVVKAATAEYQSAEDNITEFISSSIVQKQGAFITTKALHDAYEAFCKFNDYAPTSKAKFGQRITKQFGQSVNRKINSVSARVYENITTI